MNSHADEDSESQQSLTMLRDTISTLLKAADPDDPGVWTLKEKTKPIDYGRVKALAHKGVSGA